MTFRARVRKVGGLWGVVWMIGGLPYTAEMPFPTWERAYTEAGRLICRRSTQ